MLITLGTPKGGAGKTTSILTIANGILLFQPHAKIAVIDTDASVSSLTNFWKRREFAGLVTENFRLWEPKDRHTETGFFSGVLEAQTWADYTMIDLQGGVSRLNESIIEKSDLTIVPTRIGTTDLEPAMNHFTDYKAEARQNGVAFVGRLLFTFCPQDRFMTRTEKKLLQGFERMPEFRAFKTWIYQRSVYKDAQEYGYLLKEFPPKFHTDGLRMATRECMELVEEILKLKAEIIAARAASTREVAE